MHILCFDIGGSSLKCAIAHDSGKLMRKHVYPRKETLPELLADMQDYQRRTQDYAPVGVAISSCGAVDVTTGIIHGDSALPYLHGPSWKALIQEYLRLPCEIENDANCAALSELYYGKAKQIQDMAFFVVGTGIGGAIVKNRQIHHGAHRYGGEFGMMLVQDEKGALVNYSLIASTSSMVRKIKRIQPGSWDGKKIFAQAAQGNRQCQKVIDEFYMTLAFGVFQIQHTYDPQLVLFGGAISAREDFIAQLTQAYQRLIEPLDITAITPQLACCTYRQDANLMGALAHYISRRKAF